MIREKGGCPLLLIGFALLAYAASAALSSATADILAGFAAGVAVLFAVLCVIFAKTGVGGRQKASLLALIFVFLVCLLFLMMLPYDNSWHDLGEYEITENHVCNGHLGYVRWIAERGLPLQNPMTEGNSILYHPPFSHILYAIILRFGLLIGLPLQAALESLQVLGLVSAVGFAMAGGMLLRELGAKDETCALGILFCGITPAVPLMSTVPNNDLLMVWLMTLCAVYTLRWIRTEKTGDIVGMAVTLGLGMATKLNAALLIPCIAAVFVIVFVKKCKQKQWRKLLGQYGLFLLLSVPEAVAWPLFHRVRYQMPLNYVRHPAATQNVSAWSAWDRFGIPNGLSIRKLFYTGVRKTDHNVWMQTLKTAMFDEKNLFQEGTWQWYAAYLLMAAFALLCVVLLVCLVIFLLRRCKCASVQNESTRLKKLFIALYTGIVLAGYLLFCVQYPNMCSFNFRYLMNILPLLSVGLCLWEQNKGTKILAGIAVIGFAIGVCACYAVWFFQ